ncbi:hypothetical protein [Mesorhizobium sp.]|uniref:hypothetical protein n=1 Tax=Mesorhizobium sp. TaxID=1871066 RepID=UPI00258F7584|nr:hypothetical protein [Mesorhizobium sp.]
MSGIINHGKSGITNYGFSGITNYGTASTTTSPALTLAKGTYLTPPVRVAILMEWWDA